MDFSIWKFAWYKIVLCSSLVVSAPKQTTKGSFCMTKVLLKLRRPRSSKNVTVSQSGLYKSVVPCVKRILILNWSRQWEIMFPMAAMWNHVFKKTVHKTADIQLRILCAHSWAKYVYFRILFVWLDSVNVAVAVAMTI